MCLAKYFLLALGTLTFFLIASPDAYGADNVLRVEVEEYAYPGDEFEAQVLLQNPVNLGALEFSLKFDSSLVEILKVEGSYLQSGEVLSGATLIFPGGQLKLENGFNVVNMPISWAGGLTYTGEKLLGKIRFRAVNEGDAAFEFTKRSMYKPNNVPIWPTVYGDVLKVDGTGPLILVEFPQEGQRTNQDVIMCRGTVEVGAELRIDDQAVTVDALGKWVYPANLMEGDNNISLWARDPAGNITEKVINVILDKEMINFMLNSSFWGKRTLRSNIIISGQVEAGGQVQVNGENAVFQKGSQTGWYARVHLREGMNTIVYLARDQAGNTTSGQFEIIRESKCRSYQSFL